jgi:hypothetical protein
MMAGCLDVMLIGVARIVFFTAVVALIVLSAAIVQRRK